MSDWNTEAIELLENKPKQQNWGARRAAKEKKYKTSSKLMDELIPRLNDEAVLNMFISKMSHSKMEAFRKEVKIKATQAAKEKAVYLAESIGEKITGALLIEEIETGPVYPMMMKQANVMMEMSASDGPYGGDTSLPFEKIKIRYETRAEFELE